MKKFPALIIALLGASVFAQENSRPFAGASLGLSYIEVYNGNADHNRYYRGKLPWELNLGYEFRLFKYFRPSLAFALAGGGWDWKVNGHSGSTGYIYSAFDLDMNFHIMDDFLAGFGFLYGFPKLYTVKFDGIDYADELVKVDRLMTGLSWIIGYRISNHYRILLERQLSLVDAKPNLGQQYFNFHENSLRLHFRYVF